MAGKRTRSYEANIDDHIRRLVNNPAVKGSERIKVLTLAVKWYAVKKGFGTSEHGTGFDTIDRDEDVLADEPEDETTDEIEVTDDERGARNGHVATGDPDGGADER